MIPNVNPCYQKIIQMTTPFTKRFRKHILPGLLFRPGRPDVRRKGERFLGQDGGGRMTVGIGAYCESFQNIILAADCRASYDSTHLSPHDEMGKQFALPFGLYADIAGRFSHCESLIAYLTHYMNELQELPEVLLGNIREAVWLAQAQELRSRFNTAFRNQLGMTLDEWKLSTNPRILRTGRALMRCTQIEVELIVAGYTKDTEVLLSAASKEQPEIESIFLTIGSGGDDALTHLDFRKQNPHYSLPRTVVHVAEALEKAKIDDAVGPPGDYVILQRGQTRRFRARDSVVSELIERYKNRDTTEIDNDDDIRTKLKGLIY
jgi:hypothetical protein